MWNLLTNGLKAHFNYPAFGVPANPGAFTRLQTNLSTFNIAEWASVELALGNALQILRSMTRVDYNVIKITPLRAYKKVRTTTWNPRV